MGRMLRLLLLIFAFNLCGVVLVSSTARMQEPSAPENQVNQKRGNTYYVRQTVGDDANDGKSAKTAWQTVSKLSSVMHAGDTAYVGPGLYREEITVLNDGTPENRITFIADNTGQHTGDPPGVVMITGADPVDESIFVPYTVPGVYKGKYSASPVLGIVEMDGAQFKYPRREPLEGKVPPMEIVAKYPSSFYYDKDAQTLYIHTSDGRPPKTHEIELVRRGNGISLSGRHYVTVIGFTFRHVGDAGINFFKGCDNGIAINNTSYGNRQGIRVYGAKSIFVYGNTLFQNDNSGVYFALQSINGWAIANVAYDNVKGIRWSSDSVNGLALENILFDNQEAGIAIEKADGAVLRGNKMVNNTKYQLFVIDTKFGFSEYASESNCFQKGRPEQLIADFFYTEHYRTLLEYQKARGQDLQSRDGCGPLPGKIDVHKLHAETLSYTERARKVLKTAAESSGSAPNPKDWVSY